MTSKDEMLFKEMIDGYEQNLFENDHSPLSKTDKLTIRCFFDFIEAVGYLTQSLPVPDDVAERQEAQKHIEFLDKAFFYADQGGAFSGYGQKGIKKAIDTLRQFIIRAASTPSPEAQAVSEVTMEEFYKLWDKNPKRTAAEHISWAYPQGIKIKAGGG